MTERVLGPTGSRSRRRRLLASTALIGALLTIFFVAASSATLPGGSTFDTANGDLTDLTENDWNPLNQPAGNDGPVETITCPSSAPGAGTNCGLDLVNSSSDNAYGQGAKEDDESPSVVTGSIPPNKDDLSRFYVNKQRAGGNDYLYMAWERSNLLGSAHMDFEFNQKFCNLSASPTNCAANNVNPLRTKGDLLIDFDFGGSGQVGLFVHKWITSDGGNAANCEASNSLPCWDKAVTLTNAEASVNKVDVTDHNPPGNPRNLDGEEKKTGQDTTVSSEFGEAGVNLTLSGVFPQNVCVNFGSASLKSRSAGSSFSSELKDFIAPIPVSISNCGAIKIIKRTDPRGVNQNFSFTSTIPNPASGSTQPTCTTDSTPAAFTLNDNGNTNSDSTGNTENCVNVLGGSYTVTEALPVTGFALDSINCSKNPANGTSSWTTNTATGVANITLVAGETVTCVYTNKQQLGAIKVTKTTKKPGLTGPQPQAGVNFTVEGVTKATDANGEACFDGLSFGSHNVTETVPTGYQADGATTKSVNVDTNATCGANPYVGETVSFSNSPLTDVTISVDSKAPGGTDTNVNCSNDSLDFDTPNATGDGSATTSPSVAGSSTITCTITIDP